MRSSKLPALACLIGSFVLAGGARAGESLFEEIGGETRLTATVDSLVEVMLPRGATSNTLKRFVAGFMTAREGPAR